MKKIALAGLALFLLLLPTANAGACDSVKIVSFTYPGRVKYGQEIAVNVKAGLWQTWPIPFVSTCNALVEVSIVPQGYYPTLALPLSPVEPAKCCLGNDNYGDAWVSAWGVPAYQEREVKILVHAPTPESYDHCAPEDSKGNKPGFYWAGEGYYTISASVWTACVKDGGRLYQRKLGLIYVEGPPTPNKTVVCGNGICETGENILNCFSDCWNSPLIKEIPLKLTDILIIVGVIVVLAILYKKLKR